MCSAGTCQGSSRALEYLPRSSTPAIRRRAHERRCCTRPTPLEGTRPAVRRLLHGGARRRDRERRPAVDRHGPPLLAGQPAVGHHGVLADLRRLPAARRARRRPARAADRLHDRRRDLHHRLAPVRARAVGGMADRRARGAGLRRGAAHAGCALDHHDDVHGARRAEQGARRLGRGRRQRRRGRRADGRDPHEAPRLGVDLLRQRAGRHRRLPARALARRREPRRGGGAPVRHPGRRPHHRWAGAVRLRDLAGAGRRLGDVPDDRPDRPVDRACCRVRLLGVALAGTAHAARLPQRPPDRGRQRHQLPARGEHVRELLRPDALHAERAALLRAAGGARVPRNGGDGRRSSRGRRRASSRGSA